MRWLLFTMECHCAGSYEQMGLGSIHDLLQFRKSHTHQLPGPNSSAGLGTGGCHVLTVLSPWASCAVCPDDVWVKLGLTLLRGHWDFWALSQLHHMSPQKVTAFSIYDHKVMLQSLFCLDPFTEPMQNMLCAVTPDFFPRMNGSVHTWQHTLILFIRNDHYSTG